MNIKNLLAYSAILVGCITTNNSNADPMFDQQQHNVFFQNNNMMWGNNQFMNNNMNNNTNFRNNNMMWGNNQFMNNSMNNNMNFQNNNMMWGNNQFMNNNMNNNTNFRNNNMMIQNNNNIDIAKFYSNPALVKQYLQTRIRTIDSNSSAMKVREDSFNSFDWKLFLYNIKNSKSAKSNMKLLLGSSSNDGNFPDFFYNIFSFYTGEFRPYGLENPINENSTELITFILNHYILSLMSGYDISVIQNNLQTLSSQQSWMLPGILQNFGYQDYYINYYLPRLNFYNSGNLNNCWHFSGRTLDKCNIYDWNQAVNIIRECDAAKHIKKIILGTNIGEILFNKNQLINNSSNKNIKPILFQNGSCQCWMNSSLQLINSAVECSSDKLKSELQSNVGYVLMPFLKYLQDKSVKWFNNNNESVEMMFDYTSGNAKPLNGLHYLKELYNFEKTLDKNVLDAWNSLPGVKEGKKMLRQINEKAIQGNASGAFAVLSKVFPEINKLYLVNWLSIEYKNNKLTRQDFVPDTLNSVKPEVSVDIDGEYIQRLPSSLNPYFLVTNRRNKYRDLGTEIDMNKYKVGYDNEGNLALYTLTGMQLCYQSDGGHFWAHTALDNSSNSWHFSDTTGQNSNPKYKMNMFGVNNNKFNNTSNSKAQTFMYKKMEVNEIIQCLNK